MTPDQLVKLGYQAANHHKNNHPSFAASRLDDLAMHCVETALRRAVAYDPTKNPGFDPAKNPTSTPFRSWCWMQMGYACADFARKRSEGGLGRLGRDAPIVVESTDRF